VSTENSIESLSPADRRALLARLLAERSSRPERFPLSFAQQRLWFLHQLDPGSAAYNIQLALALRGELRQDVFSACLREIVRRHKTLRTIFDEVDQQPSQIVSPTAAVAAPLTDLTGLPAGARERETERLAAATCQLPFDLRRGPLLRVHLLWLGSAEWVLLVAIHHIIADGWSMAVFLGELAALYGAFAAGRPSPLPELPLHYVDFARAQLQQLQGKVLADQLAYWKERLAGSPPVLELPVDRPRSAVRTGRGSRQLLIAPRELRDRLAALSQREGMTLFMTLLAGLTAVLHGHTGQPDISVGSPITGRNRRELEGLIGLFVNTLVFRTDLSGDPSFRQLLQRVRAVALGAYAHQDLPFERLVKELQVERDLGRTPLFQVMIAWQDAPPPDVDLAGVSSKPLPISAAAAKFDLNLEVVAGAAGLGFYAEYDRDLLDPTTIHRLLLHLETFLDAAAREPDAPLSALPLLAAGERHQILAEWNDTETAWAGLEPGGELLHRLFEAQVDRTPEATALVFAGERLSYRDVDRRANALAWRLRELGCGPESTVGVFLERSLDLVVSLYAVLKAGAAYVPLAPDLPAERLLYQAQSARLALILAQEHLLGRLPEAGCPVIAVDGFGADGGEGRRPAVAMDPDHPAYVLFTSGSTGRPKGVVISHRAIVNRLVWMQEAYRLTPADRVLQKTPASFDVSVWELFWPLLTGAALVVARPGGHRDNGYLVRLINEEAVTVLHFVPSMLQMFLEEPGVESCRSLRDVVASGEALPADLAQRFYARLGARLHNLYGPTEAAVDVTSFLAERAPGARGVPIGRPIANTRIHLLSLELRPVPIGVAGELYIGGVNLARGYAGRPDLTAERFLPDPLESGAGARLYRTGDLARHRADGAIEYLGRTDHQVKVRGFRIELGEIEACLAAHPGLRDAAVVTWAGEEGHPRLVAYVVAAGAETPGAEELRGFLGRRLPDYMVPALYVPLDRLPLNPSGKLDRRALPEPAAARPAPAGLYAPPEGRDEEALAEIWSQVLGVERVGRDDNFFALGGDSILSLKVLSRARQKGFSLSLQQIFRFPTVRALAGAAAEERQTGPLPFADVAPRPFELLSEADRRQIPEGVEDAYPLARLQAGMLFHSELAPETGVYHDIFSIHLEAPFDEEPLRRAAEHVVALHPMLRTTFDLTTFGEPLQLVHGAVEADLAVGDIRHLDEPGQREYLAALMAAEKASPLDWSRGPLVRFRIYLRSAASFQLVLSFHHAALDGWSVAALVTELLRSYLALRRGEESPFSAPAGSYRQFVALERRALESAESRRYWSECLAEAAFAAVPRWRRAHPGSRGSGLFEASLDAQLSERLAELARGWGVPLKSVLLAAHCRVHAVLSGRDRLVTGLVVSGRPEEEGERVLGLFLNTLPLCLDLTGLSWTELVRQAFEGERELLTHRRFPLAELQRGGRGAPLFEMVFNFVHFHVYQALAGFDEIRAAGGEFFEQSNFPLLASFGQGAFSTRLHLRLEYDPRELPPEQIVGIAGHYERTLEALAADPLAGCGAFPLLSAAEGHQLVQEWNDTAVALPPGDCVHTLFAAQTRRSPDAPAVVYEGRSLTYAELDRAADHLASRLRSLGCGREVLVAVALERSLELVVALLGVLKAGAAYVPLDPASSPDRLAYMLVDARPGVLLTQESLLARLPADGLVRICLDLEVDAGASEAPAAWPAAPAESSDPATLAYVIYTSGSTGRPKGVEIEHRALASFLADMAGRLGLGPGDLLAAVTTISFDIAALEIFLPLIVGARVCLLPHEVAADGEALVRRLFEDGATVMQATPATWRMAVDAGLGRLPSRFKVLCGGEALPADLARALTERAAEVWNLYGPTETTIWSAAWRVPTEAERIVVGRPIANTSLSVLDRALRPVPIGAPGELTIGGANVGRGYRGRPDLAAERFLPDPVGERGSRLYRTGDLARWLPGGTIEFLGRIDHQVKIRGFRIEPGEIEATLVRHAEIRQAVVVVREDLPGGRGLTAYLVPRGDAALNPGELRAFLRGAMPEYMIPAAFVTIEALPLNANGKLDRQALPSPRPGLASSETAFVAPRDAVEQLVARTFCQVLGVERMSIYQNFFESGGHSLLATQVIVRLRRTLGIKLPLRVFFERPTVAELAREITASEEWASQSARITRARQRIEGLSAEQVKEHLKAKRSAGGTGR
jgi:amino acid adenylation domain-containing protein